MSRRDSVIETSPAFGNVAAEPYLIFAATVEATAGFVMVGFAGLLISARSHQLNDGVVPTREYLLHQAVHSALLMVAGFVTLASMGSLNGKHILKSVTRPLTPVLLVLSLVMNILLFASDFVCMFNETHGYYDEMYASETGFKFTLASRIVLFFWQSFLYVQLIPITLWIMVKKRFGLTYYDSQWSQGKRNPASELIQVKDLSFGCIQEIEDRVTELNWLISLNNYRLNAIYRLVV